MYTPTNIANAPEICMMPISSLKKIAPQSIPNIGVKLEKIAAMLGPAFFTPIFQNSMEPTPPHSTTKTKLLQPAISRFT